MDESPTTYGDVVPTEGARPGCVVVICRKDSIGVPDAVARDAFQMLLRGKHVLPASYQPSGERALCWYNVAERILKDGGTFVAGFCVEILNDGRTSQKNRFRDVELKAHAVWRDPNGVLTELTPSYGKALPFIPFPFEWPTSASLSFLDSVKEAARARAEEGFVVQVRLSI